MKEKIKIKLLQEVGLDGTRENPVYKAYGEIINAKDLGLTMADADLDGNYPVHVWWEYQTWDCIWKETEIVATGITQLVSNPPKTKCNLC
jgi:hypothetical protein